MENSTNDRGARGANDKIDNKSEARNLKTENDAKKEAADPNHQKPEKSWSPGNESERQSNESEGDRNFDRGGDGLSESSDRGSSNSLYTAEGAQNTEQQHAGTQADHQESELSNDNTWQTGSDEPDSAHDESSNQTEENFTNQGIGGNVGEDYITHNRSVENPKKHSWKSDSKDGEEEDNAG